MENDKNVNKTLVSFWDKAQTLTDDYKKQILEEDNLDYRMFAPSEKLYKAIADLKGSNNVLDYGCGNGWASIIASKEGCKDVSAVDLGENIIESVKFFNKLFNTRVNAFLISEDWLSTVESNTYDGLICSNVLDVLPLETSKFIISQLARILKKGSRAIIGMNFYISDAIAKQRNYNLIEGKYLFVNDILRLTSLSDAEWQQLFEPHFIIEKLDYFAWPGESQETRRLFYLRKK